MSVKRKGTAITTDETSSTESSIKTPEAKRQRVSRSPRVPKSPASERSTKTKRTRTPKTAQNVATATIHSLANRKKARAHLKSLVSLSTSDAASRIIDIDEKTSKASISVCEIVARHALANLQQTFKLPKTIHLGDLQDHISQQTVRLTKIVGQPGVSKYSRQTWFRLADAEKEFEVDGLIHQMLCESGMGEDLPCEESKLSFLLLEIVRMMGEAGESTPQQVPYDEEPLQGCGWRACGSRAASEDESGDE